MMYWSGRFLRRTWIRVEDVKIQDTRSSRSTLQRKNKYQYMNNGYTHDIGTAHQHWRTREGGSVMSTDVVTVTITIIYCTVPGRI